MVSIAECLIPNEIDSSQYSSEFSSRFPVGCYKQEKLKFKTRVRTQFLSPLVTYAVNFVFKSLTTGASNVHYIALKYKLKEETRTSTSHLASRREDGFYNVELYRFTSDCRIVELEIMFYDCFLEFSGAMRLEGIEFCPLEKVECQLSKDEKVDMQPISDSDTYWEEKLPNDYQDIIKWSKNIVEWRTKKELYSTLSKGFLINDGQEWFSLDKNGKKCLMLSARMILGEQGTSSTSWSLLESRFGEVVVTSKYEFHIIGEIKGEVVLPQTIYASYLVYKLPEDLSVCEGPTVVMEKGLDSDPWIKDDSWYIYLLSPQTPVIRRNVDDDNIHSPVIRPKIEGICFPQQRSDGWMEVQVWEFQTGTTTKMIPMCLQLQRLYVPKIVGLVIQGIEFRPI